MIKVSVMYPNSADATFDIEYYCNTHIPLVAELLGEALKSSHVDYGLAGGAPGDVPAFIAMGHLVFDSVDSFQKSFGPQAAKIQADIPNYTNTKAQLQISESKL
jgi:uncharacterized protein (TIGR02118 family)